MIATFGGLLKKLIPLSVAVALLYFLWGLALFIWSSGDVKKVKEGKLIMTWGIIALFVMVSIWGIVGILRSDLLGISSSGSGTQDPCLLDPNMPPC